MKVLVIGASTNPERYSNMAVKKLNENGHEVYALGIKEGKVDNTEIHTGKPVLKDIHTITMYISPEIQKEYYDYILNVVKPERIIFNPGTENYELSGLAKNAGIKYEQACTLVLLSMNNF